MPAADESAAGNGIWHRCGLTTHPLRVSIECMTRCSHFQSLIRRSTVSSLVLGLSFWHSATALSLRAADLRIERLFGAETKTGPYKHPARIEELKNGDLYVVYYGGEGEYATDTGVFGSRLKKGRHAWTTPVRIAHDPFLSLGNGVGWQSPRGPVWLFYV